MPPISLCLSYPIGLTRVISKAPTLTDGLGLEERPAKVSELAMPSKAMVLQFELLNKVVKWMRSPSDCRHFAKEVGPTVDVGH